MNDYEYYSMKESTREYAQLRYILLHSQNQQLSIPFTTLLEIAGFRFTIVSALPLQNDACKWNTENPSPLVTELFPTLSSNAEYEIWHGDDNRDYMINCTGLLPIDPFTLSETEMTRTLRPEIADQVMNLTDSEKKEFIENLCLQVTQELELMDDPPTNSPELVAFLHARGISIRHISIIYLNATSAWLKNLIYVEMVARTIKCSLWKNLRCIVYNSLEELNASLQSGANDSEIFTSFYQHVISIMKDNIVNFLNYILSNTIESQQYWTTALIPSLLSKFVASQKLTTYDCNAWELFHSICYHCGLSIEYTGNETLFSNVFPFTSQCNPTIPNRVKILLPPSLRCDPEWMFVDGMMNQSSGYISQIVQANELFQNAAIIAASLHSPLQASCLISQAFLYQQRFDIPSSTALATTACSLCSLYDSVFMRAQGIFFYASQDPYGKSQDINDYINCFTSNNSCYLPWLIFSVGMYAYPQAPNLGIEYIKCSLQTCQNIMTENNPLLARLFSQIADVSYFYYHLYIDLHEYSVF